MDENEFRRRIEVYVEVDLPELLDVKDRLAASLAGRLWPLVSGWQSDRDLARRKLALIATRMREKCPEVLAELSTEITGSDTGWP